ncbi:MAG: adenylate/guanylate cyclase domain-containing protein [Rhodospirillaceae bacterium]|nr:adenylate/guanylate cyclase domain-containing protein [Rhodospirillaceae bacterium]
MVFGPPVAGDLPDRVRAQIAADQAESEVLIGWVQMAGILFFAVLYTISGKTFPDDAMLEPVPWALGAYFGFTVIRLSLAYAKRLPAWMIVISIVVDIAVLLITIWSFHIQYMQPPGFSLKGPTMLYLFGLIALRTLRFDPRYVAMAGIVAVLGWVAMLVYALAVAEAPSLVTKDYVHYLRSTDILIGGEMDKILSLAMVTFVLVIALTRARKQLVRSVAEAQAAQDLSRFFSPEIAEKITHAVDAVKPGEGVLRETAIVFIDLRGFTALSARIGPNQTVDMLSRYQSVVIPSAQAHGGTIDKFMGDGVMVTFGALTATDSYAADALAAALEIDAKMMAWNDRRSARGQRLLAWGMGLATGTVVFGAVGDATRLEYTVIGEAVNPAAKLEKHCKMRGARLSVTNDALVLAQRQGAGDNPLQIERLVSVEGVAVELDVAVLPVQPLLAPWLQVVLNGRGCHHGGLFVTETAHGHGVWIAGRTGPVLRRCSAGLEDARHRCPARYRAVALRHRSLRRDRRIHGRRCRDDRRRCGQRRGPAGCLLGHEPYGALNDGYLGHPRGTGTSDRVRLEYLAALSRRVVKGVAD